MTDHPLSYTDQIGNTISLTGIPQRIVSLVPSQTELLFDLGLEKHIAGITKFCIHPIEGFRSKPKIGGTKKINFDKIRQINPDLIIGNKEENTKEDIFQLMQYYPVWISDIKNLPDALEMIQSIGIMGGKEEKAQDISTKIKKEFQDFQLAVSGLYLPNKRTAYFIWRQPYMSIGNTTFIAEMLKTCGLENVLSDTKDNYPVVTPEEIKKANPELILLSSEPFPFKEKHMEEFKNLCPTAKIMLVDGEFFSWYGSRLVYAPNYFLKLLRNIESFPR